MDNKVKIKKTKIKNKKLKKSIKHGVSTPVKNCKKISWR